MNNIYRLALVGTSLGHSISPWIHYDIMDKLGIEGTYELIEINRANFDNGFFRLLQREEISCPIFQGSQKGILLRERCLFQTFH